jgi:hypothetical protein
LRLGAIVALGLVVAKLLRQRADDDALAAPLPSPVPRREPWPPLADTAPATAPAERTTPAQKATARKAPARKAPARKQAAWVEPQDGVCPTTHPVKAKLKSKIFHVQGGRNYARTTPERCYRDAAAAEADGFRQSKS